MKALENLAKIGKLHTEPADQVEFDGMVEQAVEWLADANNNVGLSIGVQN
jgi:hypothetical protein